MKQSVHEPELSRPLQVDKISMGGVEEHIVASPQERKALAARFGLVDLPRFEAHLNVDHAEGHMFAVTGRVTADVVQECVVSLEPLPVTVRDEIDVLFAPAHIVAKNGEGPLADTGEAEMPEPIENGVIDLGELAAQHLAMALDPYPRKPGVSFEGYEAAPPPEEKGKNNPFAKLKVLKGDKDEI